MGFAVQCWREFFFDDVDFLKGGVCRRLVHVILSLSSGLCIKDEIVDDYVDEVGEVEDDVLREMLDVDDDQVPTTLVQ